MFYKPSAGALGKWPKIMAVIIPAIKIDTRYELCAHQRRECNVILPLRVTRGALNIYQRDTNIQFMVYAISQCCALDRSPSVAAYIAKRITLARTSNVAGANHRQCDSVLLLGFSVRAANHTDDS